MWSWKDRGNEMGKRSRDSRENPQFHEPIRSLMQRGLCRNTTWTLHDL
jgi:hypothetical protein